MKYIINNFNLFDLQAKFKNFLSKNYKNKYYKKIKQKIFSYINLCNDYYINNDKFLLKDLIKKYFKNKFSTFYYWANRILIAYKNNDFNKLLLKSTIPNNINYQYSKDVRQNICNLYFEYCNKCAGGVLSLFYNLKKGIHGEELKNKAPKNLKTFFRWLKKDERWLKIKNKIKEIKKQHPRYEVKEIGLLQMDAKYFVPSKFPVDKKYYVYDFIDEKTRLALGYVYDKLSIDNAIDSVKKAISDFKNIFGVKITRIRTDNGSEFINNYRNNQKNNVKETNFTQFLKDKNIFHQTTPVRSPQSNGKIQRFHQNYTKLFVFEEKILNVVSLQNKLNDYYYFYNFERIHKSLNFQTPFNFLNSLIK
ncbi:Spiroplasmavirus-related protein [Spiroplasma kunkelii CR2-3x]|uniref:Spiroplasmavirus-related protein n=1 Tax=Spiroplasma kunkelii CR2-3x TaxID=273035 RepID=A0A0K2JHH7_SPIKU|nr:IS481 family transposase [Spiroplasma kunkelii]ALA97686.1 Spiroplasmavirus-related protein [Spiroplasma kunkelii CR2-3x]